MGLYKFFFLILSEFSLEQNFISHLATDNILKLGSQLNLSKSLSHGRFILSISFQSTITFKTRNETNIACRLGVCLIATKIP